MSLLRRKPVDYFSQEEKDLMLDAVRSAEHATSGEIRVFIESHCRFVDAVDRAKEIFDALKMDATRDRNAVLLYVAMKDRQLALWGDKGVHERVGDEFWKTQVREILGHFKKDNYAQGIATIVREVGTMLGRFFPHVDGGKNELPDDIVFGK
ncbi:TPM domain-containing protein [Dinghuibacter silviterrae]|uniref:TLP18.3/Psb32/MOLO-1 phosphatase superfamily protein n=1 Tax=Dinghuibacter silviterrae TaxID=1539049 RepID=A0A4R8DPG1_9BACT|nr:TPM domain-containing protein [Dinghuibacter silviterrae]TDW99000.1 TLP18.3/Psb32/MOLO-1 phosphatase superfamily protein [Dinghuibacter silviterrae]